MSSQPGFGFLSPRYEELSLLLAEARERIKRNRRCFQLDVASAHDAEERESYQVLVRQQDHDLARLDKAQQLLEQGRYGFCRLCEEELPIEQLRGRPFMTVCELCRDKRAYDRANGTTGVAAPGRLL